MKYTRASGTLCRWVGVHAQSALHRLLHANLRREPDGRGGVYQWPLYKRPADLVSDTNADTAGRRLADGTLAPYPTAGKLNLAVLAGGELVWLTNRWNAYVITVQGSARLRLPDGRIMEVGYTGSNGRAYVGPGLKMVADGVIAKEDLSFEAMRQYFANHPEAMDKYLWQNPRTVFFQEVHGGPFGARMCR